MNIIFVEAPTFTRLLPDYLDDDGYRLVQRFLLANPAAGDVMPHSGGFRKLRWRDTRRGKGNRGGLRIIYYHLETEHEIWLLTLYGKGEVDDLSPKERHQLKSLIAAELNARSERR